MSQNSIKHHPIYANIESANNIHGKRLVFQLSAYEIMQLLNNQPENLELNALIKTKLAEVEKKVDKRGIDKQREVRDKYQGTHGLIFKGIPVAVERQVVYNAILKLGKSEGSDFDGELKMRSFQYPKLKKNQSSRIAFPIFVRQQDRDRILEVAGGESELILPVENNEEYRFRANDWDGVVTVERVKSRNSGHGSSHQEGFTSEAESDFQEMRPMDQGDSNSLAAGSSNRLFQTPIPYQTPSACQTPNLQQHFPLTQNTPLNIQYQNFSQFPQPPNYQIPPQNFDYQQNLQYSQNSQFQQ